MSIHSKLAIDGNDSQDSKRPRPVVHDANCENCENGRKVTIGHRSIGAALVLVRHEDKDEIKDPRTENERNDPGFEYALVCVSPGAEGGLSIVDDCGYVRLLEGRRRCRYRDTVAILSTATPSSPFARNQIVATFDICCCVEQVI